MTYATSIPVATFPVLVCLPGALAIEMYGDAGLITFTRRLTLSLFRRYSVALYCWCAWYRWKMIFDGNGWKMGSPISTMDSTCVV